MMIASILSRLFDHLISGKTDGVFSEYVVAIPSGHWDKVRHVLTTTSIDPSRKNESEYGYLGTFYGAEVWQHPEMPQIRVFSKSQWQSLGGSVPADARPTHRDVVITEWDGTAINVGNRCVVLAIVEGGAAKTWFFADGEHFSGSVYKSFAEAAKAVFSQGEKRFDEFDRRDKLCFIFDDKPGDKGPRFIECELNGKSVRVGDWSQRADGNWELRVDEKVLASLKKS